jgi:hypothetical protein
MVPSGTAQGMGLLQGEGGIPKVRSLVEMWWNLAPYFRNHPPININLT